MIFEVAHRYGDELLLWDGWNATEDARENESIDELTQLLVRADAGDDDAETDLWARYADDDRLRPGREVMTYSPYGLPPRVTDLQSGTSRPAQPAGTESEWR